MAAVNVLRTETMLPIQFTCADGTGIEKGTLLKMIDPDTVAASDGDTDIIAGIAAEEKVANDGKTKIAVYTRGIFIGTAGAAGVTAGSAIISDSSTGSVNELVNADVNSENIVGRSHETATDLQTFVFELHPFTVKLA